MAVPLTKWSHQLRGREQQFARPGGDVHAVASGAALRGRRTAARLTVAAVAAEAGLTPGEVRRVEDGLDPRVAPRQLLSDAINRLVGARP